MKVTAIIDDNLIEEVKKTTGGKNITESITIALKEYLAKEKVKYLDKAVSDKPLVFNENYSAYGIRKINRNR